MLGNLFYFNYKDGEFEPKITHGNTLTSDISFKDVLYNLRENSFKISPYPILLSIEMHCSAEQQKIMAFNFNDILKDIYKLDSKNPPDKYPSPKELKGKFIIKEAKFFDITDKCFFQLIKSKDKIRKFSTEVESRKTIEIYNKNFSVDNIYKKKDKYLNEEIETNNNNLNDNTIILDNFVLEDLFKIDVNKLYEDPEDKCKNF